MEIEIVKYNPDWVKAFEEEKAKLLVLLGSDAKAIEHVGSTSIQNQEAKPVIDIFLEFHPIKIYHFINPFLT